MKDFKNLEVVKVPVKDLKEGDIIKFYKFGKMVYCKVTLVEPSEFYDNKFCVWGLDLRTEMRVSNGINENGNLTYTTSKWENPTKEFKLYGLNAKANKFVID